jgi:hypothetical protein
MMRRMSNPEHERVYLKLLTIEMRGMIKTPWVGDDPELLALRESGAHGAQR